MRYRSYDINEEELGGRWYVSKGPALDVGTFENPLQAKKFIDLLKNPFILHDVRSGIMSLHALRRNAIAMRR